jgi:hypothetical protein
MLVTSAGTGVREAPYAGFALVIKLSIGKIILSQGKSDFVCVRLHRPSIAGLSAFLATLTAQSITYIGLAQQLRGHANLILLHLLYGCPGRTIIKQLLKSTGIDNDIPNDFYCPICMAKKTISLPNGYLRRIGSV